MITSKDESQISWNRAEFECLVGKQNLFFMLKKASLRVRLEENGAVFLSGKMAAQQQNCMLSIFFVRPVIREWLPELLFLDKRRKTEAPFFFEKFHLVMRSRLSFTSMKLSLWKLQHLKALLLRFQMTCPLCSISVKKNLKSFKSVGPF